MTDTTRTKEKEVIYRCPGCKLEIKRRAAVASLKRKSFCVYTGKNVTMRRVRWTRR